MRCAAVFTMLVLWTHSAAAETKIYSDEQLAADRKRFAEKFQILLEKRLWAFMAPGERQALQGIVISHPLRGAGPLSIGSAVVDGRPTVTMPVMTLKFLEDLSVAYAWRHTNNYSLQPMDEYLFLVKHPPDRLFPDGRMPGPLAALGVPPRIWERDSRVDDLSLRYRNTAWAFILAHELGHLLHRHPSGADLPPAQIQRQEEEADKFAVDLLGRSGTVPVGMILWFQATAGCVMNRANFSSDSAYFKWARTHSSHPVNGRRLRMLAADLRRQAAAEGRSQRGDILNFIAMRLAAIGSAIADPAVQKQLERCARSLRLEDLKLLHNRPCD